MRYGLLSVMTAGDVQRDQEARLQERVDRAEGVVRGEDGEPVDQVEHMIGRLGAYIENCWQAASQAAQREHEAMLEDIRQRDGEYPPDKLAEIRRQGGSEIYMMLTNVKCRAAEGWIRDIMLPKHDRPFSIEPTPVPDLPEDVRQQVIALTMQETQQAVLSGAYLSPQDVYERARGHYDRQMAELQKVAKEAARRAEDAIDDILVEGQWYDALLDMIPDVVALPYGVLKGPVVRRQKTIAWGVDARTGQAVPMVEDELLPVFYSPSPLDIFPAPDSKGPQDGYLFERIPMRRSALYGMIGVPSYDEERIRVALDEYQRGFHLHLGGDTQRHALEGRHNWQLSPDQSIDALEFHGSARGEWLLEWGVPPDRIEDPDADYEITALKIGRHIVRVVLNDDPLGQRPYSIASFDTIKGRFGGRGLPRVIRDLQDMCNACARALANNMALASGPMVEVEVDRLADGEDVTQLYPWRIFQTRSNRNGTPGPAVRFNSPTAIAEPLLRIYTYFSTQADNYSGVPSYEQGVNPTTGAAGTASGLSMLMNAASRQIKRVVAGIDTCIEGSVERVHSWLMRHRPSPDIYGDAKIVARGTSAMVAKEQQQVRRNEFLQAITNPIDSQIIGPAGRAELLRQMVTELDIDPDLVVPTRDEILQHLMQPPQGAVPQQGTPPGAQELLPGGAEAGGGSSGLF